MTSPTWIRRAACATLACLATAAAVAQTVPLADPAFTDAITEQLRTALPDEHVVVVGPQRLTIGNAGAAVSLGRLWQFCQANATRCDAEAARFVAAVTRSFQDMNRPPERAQVRVAVRAVATAQAYEAHSRGTGLGLQVHPFLADMVSTVVIDSPTSVRWASNKDLDALKLDAAAMLSLALANTHAQMQPLVSVATPAPKGKIGAIDGSDAYTASRLLYLQDWAPLAKAQDGVLVVVAPRPTTLLYVGDTSPESIAALRAFAHERAAGAPDAIGETLLRWTPEGWKTLP